MIKIDYNDKFIKVSGHANFDKYGKDIVCASVSSVIYTTINALLNLNNKSIVVEDSKDLIIEICSNDNTTNILIKNMLDLLDDLSKQYPSNIKISKGE